MAILEIKHLHKSFGGLLAINDLSLAVDEGELRCIIGPNGAGKTTLFNLISGAIKPDEGQIIFEGHNLHQLSVAQISRLGVGRKFQSPNIFNDLSVWENLQVAMRGKWASWRLALATNGSVDEIIEATLETIELQDKRRWPAVALSHGEKQWLEIGMLLSSRGRLLLLDEPTAGMTPAETHKTAQLIQRISRDTTTIVIEHDLKFIREIGIIVTILHHGTVLAQGPIDDMAEDQSVRQAYLGTKAL